MNDCEKIMETRIRRFLANAEIREKSIESSIEYGWAEINKKEATLDTIEWYAKDIHDYKIMLNELNLVKKELKDILADVEAEREVTTSDGWVREE